MAPKPRGGGLVKGHTNVSDARTDCVVSPIRARLAVLGRFDPFLCRALLAFGSETACKRRSSKCSASRIRRHSPRHHQHRRIVCAWWPDEGSALEMACSGGRSIACEGAQLIEPVDLPNLCRGCATAVSCRSASCTSRTACPFPVCTSVAHLEPRYM